ncbi:MAG: TetR/AcrR family transcriptional regulator [Parvularculaceae bacterium]|nr:TetR/AcrR family transcriptional regulator [Parvularculaceae bacterium]
MSISIANTGPTSRDPKEAAIIEAARKTFLANGYDGASMDEIALVAGVSKRTVYNRFRSKEELFAAAIDETCRRILPVDIAAIEASRSTDQFVNEMAHAFLNGILEPDALALRRIASFEAGRNPALGRTYLKHGPAHMAAAFAPILDRAAKREGIEIADVQTAIYQLGALISEPLYTEVLLGVWPDDLNAAIDRQIATGLEAFRRIYGM